MADTGFAERLRQAAAGDVGAQYNIAQRYAYGEGVAPHEGEAVRWLGVAARAHHPGAQGVLGERYLAGLGVHFRLESAGALPGLGKGFQRVVLIAEKALLEAGANRLGASASVNLIIE